MLGLFAAVAIMLATVGIYGVIAQGVRARTQEFGVRLALGATAPKRVLAGGETRLGAPLIGLASGLVFAWLTGRVVETLLFGVTPRNPLVFVSVAVLLVVVSVSSCGLPALQACRTEPALALRDE